MTTLSISLSVLDPPPHPNLPSGVQHIAEIMPHVLARHGLSSSDRPNAMQLTPATKATDLSDVMIASLESALAS